MVPDGSPEHTPTVKALSLVGALARRPTLWPTAARAYRQHLPRRWWRHAPFLPVPDRRWIRFRMVAAYGGSGRRLPDPNELLTWLEWRRSFPTG